MDKQLISITDCTAKEVQQLIELAFQFKEKKDKKILDDEILKGKVVAMIFEKASLRTKVAFEVATAAMGGIPVYLTSSQILASGHNEKGRESVPDIARNLERFADIVLARVYKNEVIEEIAASIDKPVINLLCDKYHPTQALADLMAIQWHFPDTKNLTVTFIGDGNNVAISLMHICSLYGINFHMASPKEYEIPMEERNFAIKHATLNGTKLLFTQSTVEAMENADILYTDTFVSMGMEDETAKRLKDFQGYQVNMDLLKSSGKKTLFMHCLPAHRGEEVTDEVMDCDQSIVFDQAECRLHIAKALLSYFLK